MMKSLNILFAGCVKGPVETAVAQFQQRYPDVEVHASIGGSVDNIRKAIAGVPCDVLISADDQIIESMMMPALTDGYRVFCGNAMAIAARAEGAQISAEHWIETLCDPQTTFCHFDPMGDPNGYRAVMVMMLADHVQPGLSQTLLGHPGRMILKKGMEAQPQFMFTYLSAAKNSGKPYAALPDEMNLGNDAFSSLYQTAVVDLEDGKVAGSPISHAAAILQNSANRPAAQAFLKIFFAQDFPALGYVGKTRVVGKDPLAENLGENHNI